MTRHVSVDTPTQKPSILIGERLRPIANGIAQRRAAIVDDLKKHCDATPLASEGQDMTLDSTHTIPSMEPVPGRLRRDARRRLSALG
jgi:hypothetical protein